MLNICDEAPLSQGPFKGSGNVLHPESNNKNLKPKITINKVSFHAKFHTYAILRFSEIEIIKNGFTGPENVRDFRETGLSPVSPKKSSNLRVLKPLLVK